MTYAGEKRVQRGLALLLTLMMLLTGFSIPAVAEDWQSLTVTLNWTDGAGNPASAVATPVTWSGTPDYWALVPQEALANGMTLAVSDSAGQYTYTTPNGDWLTGVMDAGTTIDGRVLPVTILAMDASGNTVATYNLYISTQREIPEEPKPEPKTADVTIQYVSDDGMVNESETVTVTEGVPYTAIARSYEGYDLTSADSVTVEVYSDGSVNVNPVMFTYAKAYVAPKTADVTIQYVSDDGAVNESETVTVTEGTPYTATARAYEGYDLTSADSVMVEVYSDGSVNVNPVMFTYAKAYVAPKTADVTIQYVSDDGAVNESETVTVTEGTPYTATARAYEGYDLTSADSVTVEVYSDGSVNVNPVVFSYTKAYVAPKTADVTIQYVSDDGMVNESETVTVTEGTPYTATARAYEGYDLTSADSVTVEVYSDGSVNVNPVVFTYTKAYVAPKTADVTIQYVSDDGMVNESETVTVTEGTPYTATARAYEGYDLTSADSVTVEVYSDGSVNVNPVVFTYAKAYVAPKAADVTIQYVSDDGMVNESETVTVTEGTPYTATARSYEGYDLTSADSVMVEVYSDGSVNVNPVVFTYAKAYVAPKTADVTIQYVSDDGMVNESETVTVTEGTPYTATARSYEGYDLTSADSVTVEVYSDGSVNVNPVVFSYTKAYVEPETPVEPEVPAEPVPATIMVYYRDLEGVNVASAQQKSWTTGTYTITAEPTDLTEGYQLAEGQPASYQVEVYDNGNSSVDTVTFLYQRIQVEEPEVPVEPEAPVEPEVPVEPEQPQEPVNATITVHYLNEAGERIAPDQQVMLSGNATTTVTPDLAVVPATHDAASAAAVDVSVSMDGVATPAEVTFVFKAIEVEEPDVPVPQGEMINRFGQTVKKGVYVRSEPSTSGKAVDKVAMGTVVYMLRAENGTDGDVWYRVLYAGEQRFIRSDCIEMMTKKDSDAYMAEHYDEPLPEYTREDLDGASQPESPAEPVTVDVMVYYVTEDGQQLDAHSIPATSAGAVTVTPTSEKIPADYILMSAGSVQVTVNAETGAAEPAEVRFVYRVPVPAAKVADVIVLYVTEAGEELDRQTVSCSSDAVKTLTPSSGKTEGYALVSAGSVDVTVDPETGVATPAEVRFTYRALTPEIKTVNVPVYYIGDEGVVLDEQTVTCTSAAVTTITANSTKVQGYELNGASSVQVTVDATTGEAQPAQVTFTYVRPSQYVGYALTTQAVALRTEISSSDSSIITRLEKDTLLYVYGQQYAEDGQAWSTVQTLDEQPGMVLHSALRTITKEEAQYYIDLWEKENIPETPAEPTETPPQIVGTAVTVGDGVHFRQAYDSASAILAVLPKDTEVDVLGQAYDSNGTAWHSVRYSGTLGFIRADMLRFLTKDDEATNTTQPTIDPAHTMSSYGYITTRNVNFRKEASTSSSKLGQLQKYAMCLVYGSTEVNGKTWYRIKYNDQEGYVSGEFFKHMTIAEFTEFLNSDEYRQGITNNTTANNNQDNTGNYTGGSGVVSEEDKVVDQWTNPNNGLNVSYEPFDPFATPEPITSELPDPAATETVTPSPTLESLPALDVNPEPDDTENGGSATVIVIVIVLLLLAGGGVYAYMLYTQKKRKAAQRAAQRRAQAAQQQRMNAQQQRSTQPGQAAQPRTGTYTNQAGTARPNGYQQPQARKPYAPGQSPYQRPAGTQEQASGSGYQRPEGAQSQPQARPQNPYTRPVTGDSAEHSGYGAPQTEGTPRAQNPYTRPVTGDSAEPTGYSASQTDGATPQRQGRRAYRSQQHASQYTASYRDQDASAEQNNTDSFN